MNRGNTYFEINLQKQQRLNELRTLYTIDELINHCYDKEQKLERIKEIIDHYAVEDEDYSKIYNNVEKELLKVLGSDEE